MIYKEENIMFEIIPFTHRNRNTTVYDPFAVFNEIEKNFFGNAGTVSAIRTDVKDTGDAYELTADLPGCSRDDINIEINDDVMTISATRHSEAEEKNNGYIRVERSYGACSRSFDVGGINTDAITASYENGVLKLNLPKAEEEKPKTRKVEIG